MNKTYTANKPVTMKSGEAQKAYLEAEVARLNGQVAEWSRQNLAIVAAEVKARKRAEAAERERDAARAEVARLHDHAHDLAHKLFRSRRAEEVAEWRRNVARVALEAVARALEANGMLDTAAYARAHASEAASR